MKKLLSVLLVVMMLVALSATAFAQGQDSPPPELPSLGNKEVEGTGTTANGDTFTVVAWNADDVPAGAPFKNEEEAVKDAFDSDAFKKLVDDLDLDLKKCSGTSLLSLNFEDGSDGKEPITVVVIYDGDGKPTTGLYFYDGKWYTLEVQVPEGGKDGEYTLVFGDDKEGLNAEVTVTITDK